MTMIDAPTLLTIIFVLVDDWYQAYGHQLKPKLPGPQPKFSESELLTLLLAMDYFPFPGETQFLGFIRANYLNLFPYLLDQSQFNRRARRLEAMLEEVRRSGLRNSTESLRRRYSWIPSPSLSLAISEASVIVIFSGVPVMDIVPVET